MFNNQYYGNPYYGATPAPIYPPINQPMMPQVPVQAPVQQTMPVQAQPTQGAMQTNKMYASSAEEARRLQLPAYSDFLILDSEKPLLYRRTTDATGKPNVEVFDVTPHKDAPVVAQMPQQIDTGIFARQDDIEALKREIDQLKGRLNNRQGGDKK